MTERRTDYAVGSFAYYEPLAQARVGGREPLEEALPKGQYRERPELYTALAKTPLKANC